MVAMKRTNSHKSIGSEYDVMPRKAKLTKRNGEAALISSYHSHSMSSKVEELKKIKEEEKSNRDLRGMLKERQNVIQSIIHSTRNSNELGGLSPIDGDAQS